LLTRCLASLVLAATTYASLASPTTAPIAAADGQPGLSPTGAEPPFPFEATIPEIQRAMEEGRLTSAQLVDYYLERIAAYDDSGPRLNALISVNPNAREVAAALDAERAAGWVRSPLHGIPVVVKDNIDTADLPTTAGSKALEGFQPADDAFQVQKLRDAGAVILGKTNLCEFGTCWQSKSTLGGQTLDPYDLERDPGGSSGGTAVAVTANLAAAGLGTDTCGSVRVPAAHNNIYGLRPTTGLSSRSGVIPFSPTLDEIGPMARSVVDLAILLDATVGRDPADPVTVARDHAFLDEVRTDGLAGRRIGVLGFGAGPPVNDPLRAALRDMEAIGAEVADVALPPSPVTVAPYLDEFRSALAAYLAAHPNAPVRSIDEVLDREPADPDVTPGLRDLAAAPDITTQVHERSVRQRAQWRDVLVALMEAEGLDAIAYPVTTRVAAPVGIDQDHFDCTIAAFSGLPAIAMPVGFTPDKLPVGLELLGRPFDEATLISIAAGFEAHSDHRRPPESTPPIE
jgi:amidase